MIHILRVLLYTNETKKRTVLPIKGNNTVKRTKTRNNSYYHARQAAMRYYTGWPFGLLKECLISSNRLPKAVVDITLLHDISEHTVAKYVCYIRRSIVSLFRTAYSRRHLRHSNALVFLSDYLERRQKEGYSFGSLCIVCIFHRNA